MLLSSVVRGKLSGFRFWANGVGRYRRGRRMDRDRGAKRKCESQACAINDLRDVNCDRSVAPRAVLVPRRASDYPRQDC